LGNVLNRALK